jgi:hypothetical protein
MVTCTSRLSDHWAKHSHRQTFYQIYNVPTVIIIKERVLQHSHRQAAFSHTDSVLTDRHRSHRQYCHYIQRPHKRITFPLKAISQTTVHLQTNCVPTAKQVLCLSRDKVPLRLLLLKTKVVQVQWGSIPH